MTQPLLIDVTKLKTVKNYAILKNKSPQTIYQWAQANKIKLFEIDGVMFIMPTGSDPS